MNMSTKESYNSNFGIKPINWYASKMAAINEQNFFTSYPISRLLFDNRAMDKIKKDMHPGVKIEELNTKGYRSDEFKVDLFLYIWTRSTTRRIMGKKSI